MKILVVASPHAVATRDVYLGHLRGLRAVLGEENVFSYDIIKRFNLFTHFTEWLEEKVGEVPRSFAANILAAEPVFGAAHLYEADVVYLISPMYFPMTLVQMLRKDGFQVWSYFTECPYEDEFWARVQAPLMDVCFVSDKMSVARYRMFNDRTYYLPHCYDPAVHYPAAPARAAAARDNGHRHVSFIGTGFPGRRQFLEAIDWSGIDLRLYGNWWEVDEASPLHPYVRHRLVENQTTAQLYRGSSVGISMHRTERFYRTGGRIDPNEAYSIGPRAYELAACGLFQVSDPRAELLDVFGDSVPIFRNPQELEEVIRGCLSDDDYRTAMADAQRQAVQGHTVEARARQLIELAA